MEQLLIGNSFLPDHPKMDDFKTASIGERLKHWRTQQKISQLDLALESETSARHISFIETGKAHPTRELVIKLADSIGIPLSVRNNMLIAAGYAPQYEKTGLNTEEMQKLQDVLENMVRQNGCNPSILVDQHWTISFSNLAFDRLCQYFVKDPTLLEPPRNLLKIALHPQGLISHCPTPLELYPALFSRVRRTLSVMGDDPELEQLFQEIKNYQPPGFDEENLSLPQLMTSFTLRKDQNEIQLAILTSTLGEPLTITLRELQMEFCIPANDNSKSFLEKLVE